MSEVGVGVGVGGSTRAIMFSFPRLVVLSISVIILVGAGTAMAENQSEPLKNVNLSPFWQWRSAYECLLLLNSSSSSGCMRKDVITLSGWIQVNQTEIGEYCKEGGCADHVRDTLTCIHSVKRDFWFGNKATVPKIRDLINHGCSTNSEITTIQFAAST